MSPGFHAGMLHAVLATMAVLMVRGTGWVGHVVAGWVGDRSSGEQLHPAPGQRPGWSLVTSGCIGQA